MWCVQCEVMWVNACQCTNRTTLTLKFKEVENWEEYIVVPVWQEEGGGVCVCVCVCVCVYICVRVFVCTYYKCTMYETYLQTIRMSYIQMHVTTQTNMPAYTDIQTYLLLPSPQPSSHKATDASSLLAFVLLKAVFQVWQFDVVLCQVKEERLAWNGLHLRREGG